MSMASRDEAGRGVREEKRGKLAKLGFVCLLAAAMLGGATEAHAATETFHVNTTADSTDTATGTCTNSALTCSLRDAINLFNTNPVSTPIVITFDKMIGSTITLTSSLPKITGNETLTITSATGGSPTVRGPNLIMISGAGKYEIFDATSYNGTLTVNGVTLENGYSSEGPAINSFGTLVLTNDTFFNNSTVGVGGAVYDLNGNGTPTTVTNCTFVNNSALSGGGAMFAYGKANFSNDTFYGNTTSGGNGGAILYQDASTNSPVNVQNSTFVNNNAFAGGAFYFSNTYTQTAASTLANNIFYKNTDNLGGAGVGAHSTTADVVAKFNLYYGNTDSLNGEEDCTNCTTNSNTVAFDPQMLPLGYYGGSTQTMMPKYSSPAICAGDSALDPAGSFTTDQRGYREYCSLPGSIDMGAVQTGYMVVTDTSDSASDTGSLRYAMTQAQSITTGTDITFASNAYGTITLASTLPTVEYPLTVIGPDADALSTTETLIISGAGLNQVFNASQNSQNPTTALALYGLEIANAKNDAGLGGAVWAPSGPLAVTNVVFSNNSAWYGGAIAAGTNSNVLTGNYFAGNSATHSDNGVGGGAVIIYADTEYAYSTTVQYNTFSNNSTTYSSGGNYADGGAVGIYAGAGSFTSNTNLPIEIDHNTFSSNSSTGNGGAVDIAAYSSATTVTNNTFVGNQTAGTGSAYSQYLGIGLNYFYNNIFQQNTAGTGAVSYGTNLSNNLFYENLDSGNSTEDDCSNCTGGTGTNAVTGSSANLTALGSNGGTTQTMLPLPGSPAICAASGTYLVSSIPPTTDQRGLPDSVNYGSTCYDMGAVQTNYSSVQFTNIPVSGDYTASVGSAATTAPIVSVTESGNNVGGVPVSLTDASTTVSGLGPQTTVAGTGATFSLLEDSVGEDTTLSATLPITLSYSLTTATTAGFDVTSTSFNATVGTSVPGLSFSINGSPFTSTQTQNWTSGTNYSLTTVSPQAGPSPTTQYVFTGWSDGTPSTTDLVTANSSVTSYTAEFTTQYELSIQPNNITGGIVMPLVGTFYNSGQQVQITATPLAGYVFTGWTGSADIANPSSATTTVTMNGPEMLVANFQQATVNVTVGTSPNGLIYSVNGQAYFATGLQIWNQGQPYTLTTSPTQFGGPGVQYVFTQWSDGTTTTTDTVIAPTTPATYTAEFTAQYLLTNLPGSGGIATPLGLNYYNSGTVVPITATPSSGYYFTGWTGSADIANANSASTTITMNQAETITANFAPIPTFTVLTVQDVSNGFCNASACTLRDAITAANTAGAGNINFSSTLRGVIALASPLPQITTSMTISGPGAALIVIDGGKQYQVFNVANGVTSTISGLTMQNGATGTNGGAVYADINANITLSNDLFQYNAASQGGAVFGNGGALTITNSSFVDNSATVQGGAVYNSGATTVTNSTFSGNNGGNFGGAILIANGSAFTGQQNTFVNNKAANDGGAIYVNATHVSQINNNIFQGNSSNTGAVRDLNGNVTSSYNTFYQNTGIPNCNGCASDSSDLTGDPMLLPLGYYGGQMPTYLPKQGSPVIGAANGGVDSSAPTTDERGYPTGSSLDQGAVQTDYLQVTSNADSGAGTLRAALTSPNANGQDIYFNSTANGTIALQSLLPQINTPVTIVGNTANNGSITIDGGNAANPGSGVQIFNVGAAGQLSLSYLTIQNGYSANTGGAVNSVGLVTAFYNDVFTGNSAGNGGAFAIESTTNPGVVQMTNNTFSSNTAISGGGAGVVFGNPVLVSDNTFSNNSSTGGEGGALVVVPLGNGVINNNTFSQNSITGQGGALVVTFGPATVANNTFVGNSASVQGGGVFVDEEAAVTASNNIFDGNQTTSGGAGLYAHTTKGSSITPSNNVYYENLRLGGTATEDDCNSCNTGTNNISATVSPVAATLASNGGPTQTFLPLPMGGAICAGSASLIPTDVTTDQRGFAIENTTYTGYSASSPCVDAGSVQSNYQSIQFSPAPTNGYSATTNTVPSPAPVVTVTESGNNVGGVPVTLTDGSSTVSGLGPVTTVAGAGATFSSLEDSAVENTTLTAALQLTSTVSLTAATEAFDVTPANQAPSITSGNSTTFTAGVSNTYTIMTNGYPTPTINTSSTLPNGVTLTDNGDGTATLAGNPTTGTGGVYSNIVINAQNGISPNAQQTFTLTVDERPSLTSGGTANFTVGLPGSFTVTTHGYPAPQLQVTNGNVPAGMSFKDNGNGTATISGTPTAISTNTVTVDASNGIGPGSVEKIKLYVNAPTAFLVTTLNDDATGNANNCVAGATDASGGNSNCSLRDAITAANAVYAANNSLGSTISFLPSLTSSATQASPAIYSVAINNTLNITGNLSITGPTDKNGNNLLAIDGGYTPSSGVQVFNVGDSSGITVNVSNLIVQNGSSAVGGGMVIGTNGTIATLNNMTFAGNHAIAEGGGLAAETGTVTIKNSTFNGNVALLGAGIFTGGGSSVTLDYTTVSGNSATANGGGVGVNGKSLLIVNSTISNNTVSLSGQGGAGLYDESGTTSPVLANTILSNNTQGGVEADYYTQNRVSITDNGGNLIGSTAPGLAALNYYGGPTQTMVPLPGSAAICGGLQANLPGGATLDQRGYANTNTTYTSGVTCVDSGAVQTNYALNFATQQPTTVQTNTVMSPSPVVTVTESGNTATAVTSNIVMSDADTDLAGASTTSVAATSGAASFSNLQFTNVETGDTLQATLIVTPSINVTATSTSFDVAPRMEQVTVGTSPAGLQYTLSENGGTPANETSNQTLTLDQGTVVTLTTTGTQYSPDNGTQYVFSNWSASLSTFTGPETVIVATSAVTDTAEFSTNYLLNVAANNTAYGTVTAPATSGNYYGATTKQTITAVPNAGYYFTGWTGSADIANASSVSTSVTMNAPESITANFAAVPVFTVITLSDNSGTDSASNCDKNGICPTLRDAIDAVNAAGAGTITFNSGLTGTITLGSALPQITAAGGAVTITGPKNATTGVNAVTIDGAGSYQILYAASGTDFVLNNLNLQNGYGNNGGGVSVSGRATLNDDYFYANAATTSGGAVYTSGVLTVNNSTFAKNGKAGTTGDTIYADNGSTTTVNYSTFDGAGGPGALEGGAIYSVGATLTVSNSTFTHFNVQFGAAIYVGSGTANISNSIFANNTENVGVIYSDSTVHATNNLFYDGQSAVNDCYSCASNTSPIVGDPMLAPLANYGGAVPTELPLPGSAAIGVANSTLIPSGFTTDERGYSNSTTYGSNTLYDVGAVQTNYALNFATQQPTTVQTNTVMSPSPVVTVTENGNTATAVASNIVMKDADTDLTAGSTTTVAATSGAAAFGNMLFTNTETGDTLTATLTVTPSINVTATSSSFNVTPATFQATVGTSPSGLSFSIGGTTYTTTQTPTWTVANNYALNTTATQYSADNQTQYVFAQWSDGTTTTADSVTATASTTAYTAQFNTSYTLNIASNNTAYGTVQLLGPSGGYYSAQSQQVIVAIANPGYYFSGWTTTGNASDITSTASAITQVTMNAPENLTANFAANPVYIVTNLTDNTDTNPDCTSGNGTSCSLRDAITLATTAGYGNINFAPSLNGTITLTSALPQLLGYNGSYVVTGPAASTGKTIAISGNNAYQIFSNGNSSGDALQFANLTMENGYANGSARGANDGGAISNLFATLNVNNCIFLNNTATDSGPLGGGGAIYSFKGVLTITNSSFSGNNATGNSDGGAGGAVDSLEGSTDVISNSTFSTNSANMGGALSLDDSAEQVSYSTFSGNSASSAGGGVFSFGSLTLSNNTFSANYASQSNAVGGAVVSQSSLTAYNNIFVGNGLTAENSLSGAGIYETGGIATLSNNDFFQNLNAAMTEDDCKSCNVAGSTNINVVTGDPKLAQLGNYGGPVKTMLPLPGSAAIAAASGILVPAGFTKDERGYANSTTYGMTAQYDLGAVQTNYALNFTAQQPTTVKTNTVMSPSPVVTVTENGNAATAVAAGISVADNDTDLTAGSTTSVIATSGAAAFSNLLFTNTETGDALKATMPVTSSLNVTVTSNTFDVLPQTFQATVGTSPSGLSFSIGGTPYTTTQMPTWTPGNSYVLNTTATQYSSDNSTQYVFTQWSDGTATTLDNVTASSSTPTYTAQFSTNYVLNVSSANSAQGAVTVPAASGGYYLASTSQTITAVPATGYYFTNWTTTGSAGDIASTTSAITTVTMNAPETLTANFAPLPVFTVTTTNDDNGNVANCTGSGQAFTCQTLRDAITAANTAGAGNISFTSTLSGTIALGGALPDVTATNGAVIITGPVNATTGANAVTIDGGSTYEVLKNAAGTTVVLNNLNVAHGDAPYGAVQNLGALTLNSMYFSNNTGANAGAVYSGGLGNIHTMTTLTINNSSFYGNSDTGSGGGASVYADASSVVTVNYSTFDGGGIMNAQAGGAITSQGSAMTVSNSTFRNLSVSGDAAALGYRVNGPVTVNNSIFANNTVGTANGGTIYEAGNNVNPTYAINNNLFFHNYDSGTTTEDDCVATAGSPCTDIGTVTGSVSGDPMLAAMGNYGGAVPTELPLPGSAAIAAANATLVPAGFTKDERGYANSTTYSMTKYYDIGAVQTNYALNFTAQQPSTVRATWVMSPSPIVTVTENGNNATAVTSNIAMSDADTDLTGTATTTVAASSGAATFNNLTFTNAEPSGDTLTATLAVTPMLNVTTTSNSFIVLPNTVNVTVSTTPANLAFSIDGNNFTSSQMQTWTVGDNHTLTTTTPQYSSDGTLQYLFHQWNPGTSSTTDSVTASTNTTAYTAEFYTHYLLTVIAGANGSVTPVTSAASFYRDGERVNLSATPAAGYYFTGWTGSKDVNNLNATSTYITVRGVETVTANFAPIPSYTVTTLSDTNDGSCSTTCSLRDAITAANANNNGAGNISFAQNLTGTITLTSALPALSGMETIIGPGANVITVSGANAYRVFGTNEGATLAISGLTIANGNSATYGGGIDAHNVASLKLSGISFALNTAGEQGGALSMDQQTGGAVSVSDSTFVSNSSPKAGAIYVANGTLGIDHATFNGNTSTQAGVDNAGAIVVQASAGGRFVTIDNSTFDSNSAKAGAGAIVNNGTLSVANSIFTSNRGAAAGAVYDATNAAHVQYTLFDSNTGGDCVNCSQNSNAVSGAATLATLGYYGGPVATELPEPGSAAICAASGALTLNGVTLDARGAANSQLYGTSTCYDLGAVQTHYSISYSSTPQSPIEVTEAMVPAQIVTVSENSVPYGSASYTVSQSGVGNSNALAATVSMADANSDLTTTPQTASTSSIGQASFSALKFTSPTTNDTLTGTLALNATTSTSISATSSSFNVTLINTTTTLQSNLNPAMAQNPITLTATVSSDAGNPTSGVVNFYANGSTLLGSGNVGAGGIATYILNSSTNPTQLAAGTYPLTAQYQLTGNYASSTSTPALSQLIQDFGFNFTIQSVTVIPGNQAVVTFTASPTNGTTFPATINLSLNGLPNGATYTFAPANLAAGSGTQTVTVTINLPAVNQYAKSMKPVKPINPATPLSERLAPLALGLLLLPFSKRMRRSAKKISRVMAVLVLVLAGTLGMIGVTGCGDGHGYFSQPVQSYTVTLTGTAGPLTHSVTFTLTVE